MFQDEAGFGRINTPKYCWTGGKRPSVPCHHIREYRYVFGAVDPISGDDCFLVAPQCNTVCMNVFLDTLSKQYQNDEILIAEPTAETIVPIMSKIISFDRIMNKMMED